MSRSTRRRDIDGLRGLAVIGVVVGHAAGCLSGGTDVFFVISGFLITRVILDDVRGGTFSFAQFWERRVRRLLPALTAVTLFTLAAGWFLFLPSDFASLGRSVISLTLLSSNVHFWRETGYFSAAAEKVPLLHTWSLAVNEQFYVLLPLLIVMLTRLRRANWLAACLALGTVGSLVLSEYGVHRHPSATFYLLPTRAWEMFAGSLLVCFPVHVLNRSARWAEVVSIAGFVAILTPSLLYDETTPFPGLTALPSVLGAAMVISAGGAAHVPRVNRVLSSRPMVGVGLISYSLYLWHWPILAFARYQSLRPLNVVQTAFAVMISVLLALLSWRYIEEPFRARTIVRSRRRLYVAGGLCQFAVLSAAGVVVLTGGFERRLSDQARSLVASTQRDVRWFQELGIEDVPANLVRLGDAAAPARLLVWGDSHAMSVLPGIDAACRAEGISARAATRSGTPPAIGYSYERRDTWDDCIPQFNDAVLRHVLSSDVSVVLLVCHWENYASRNEALFSSSLINTVDRLQGAGVTVYFMKQVPDFDFDVPRFVIQAAAHKHDLNHLAMQYSEYDGERGMTQLLAQLEDRGVRILDPVPILRARGESAEIMPLDQGGCFYFDSHHLSNYGALALKPLFVPMVHCASIAGPQ